MTNSNLSSAQFSTVPIHKVAALRSGDYDDTTVAQSRHWMNEDYKNYVGDAEYMGTPVGHPDHNPEDFSVHSKDAEFGGTERYIAHLAQDIRKHGVREPLTVRGDTLTEGHHRFHAAQDAGLTHVPVRFER